MPRSPHRPPRTARRNGGEPASASVYGSRMLDALRTQEAADREALQVACRMRERRRRGDLREAEAALANAQAHNRA